MYSGGLAARAAGNTVLQKGTATSLGPYAPVFLLENPLPDREAWQATVYRVTKSGTLTKRPCTHRCKLPVRIEHEGGVAAWLVGILAAPSVHRQLTASAAGGMALSESFLKPLITGDQKASLASVSPQLYPFSLLELSLAWGSSL